MKVTTLNQDHVPDVVELHMWAFKEHLNILLGKKYITYFLRWFINRPGCVNVVYANPETGDVSGYIVGAPWGYQQQMNKDLLSTATLEMLKRPWIFFHRKIWLSVWLRSKTILGLNKFIDATRERYSGKIISLVGIGVSKTAMGKGIAILLMDTFVDKCREAGYDYARLSVYKSNMRARKFYEKMGWTAEDSTTSVMGYYKKLQ